MTKRKSLVSLDFFVLSKFSILDFCLDFFVLGNVLILGKLSLLGDFQFYELLGSAERFLIFDFMEFLEIVHRMHILSGISLEILALIKPYRNNSFLFSLPVFVCPLF